VIIPADGGSGRRHWLAYAALLTAVLGIAWSAIFVRWAGVPGPTSAFYRVLIAGAVLAAAWTIRRIARPPRRPIPLRPRAFVLALAGGAFFGFDLALYNTAVMRTTAATATLLGNNAPIFVGIGTWLVFKRRPPRVFWLGLGLALCGAVAIIATSVMHGGARSSDLRGDLQAIAAAIFFAGYMLTTERVRRDMDTLTFSTAAAAGSVVTLLLVCVALRAPLTQFPPRTWAALAGLGLISQLGAYFALVYALGHLPATVTSVGLLAQVPLTALLAVPMLGEGLTLPQAAGGLIVLAGIYVVNRGSS
jgi:drug/metabolite transporter (DMT)-like permease